ncbi:MAG: hypothetical protein V3V31_15260 [Methylococcales bacterium]
MKKCEKWQNLAKSWKSEKIESDFLGALLDLAQKSPTGISAYIGGQVKI